MLFGKNRSEESVMEAPSLRVLKEILRKEDSFLVVGRFVFI